MALTKRQEQGAVSREQILEAAETMMADRGVAATSISALTKSSGLPASSIYWHFGSKDGVFSAVMERGAERFFDSLAEPDSFSETGAERVRAQLEDTARAFEAHGQFLRLLLTRIVAGEADSRSADPVIARVRGEARTRIQEMLTAAGGRSQSRALTDFVLSAIDGIFIAQLEEPRAELRDRMDQLALAIEALLAD